MQLIVVTGLSGSGKSIALRELEDLGYYCIDNLPASFLAPVCLHLKEAGRNLVAVALDSRSEASLPIISESFKRLKNSDTDLRTLCLTASTECLVQRYSETRRQHPLSLRGTKGTETLVELIEKERELLEPFMTDAHIVDTSGMVPNTLRHWIRAFVRAKEGNVLLTFESFGFKRGLPLASDLVFDVRCLPNPYWNKDLRPFTGRDEPVIKFLESKKEVQDMISDISGFVKKWLPAYEAQNRHYLTVSVGCTGGQHRSVYIAERLGEIFSASREGTIVRHRTLDAQPPTL